MRRVVIAMTFYSGPSTSETDTPSSASPWHRARPGKDDRHTSLLFWMTVLGLGCVLLLGVTYGASSVMAQKGSEKLLRLDQLFPKLKGIHRERKANAFPTSEPTPSELAHSRERKTAEPVPPPPTGTEHPKAKIVQTPEPPRMALAEPGLNLVPPVELTPPPPLETCSDPAIYLHPCSPQRGDSPMIRNWKTLTMYSLLSAAAVTFVPQPTLVFGQDKGEVKGIEELQKSIQELVKRLDMLEKKKVPSVDQDALTDVLRAEIKKLESGALADLGRKVKAVGDDVLDVKSDIAALKSTQLQQKLDLDQHKKQIGLLSEEIAILQKRLLAGNGGVSPAPAVDKAFMEEFRSSLRSLQETIAKLGPTKERISLSPPNGAATNMGRVMLVNLYTDDLLFMVNGSPFRVPAGKSRMVDNVPVGTMQYLVHSDRWGTLENRSTLLAAGDTFTLTASNPR